jgi:DNA-binding LacI/PurR family transcriptional regulator
LRTSGSFGVEIRQTIGVATGSTLHDVAKLAGVSARTVSRVVNEEGGYGPDVHQRVLAAINKVGYRPNRLARALITRRSGTVGLVVPDMTDPYFAEFADTVQQAAQAHGLTMFIAQHRGEIEATKAILDSMASFAVDGLIVFTPQGDLSAVLAHAAAGVPVVLIDQAVEAPNVVSLVSAIAQGAEDAVCYLAKTGRRRIAMIANSESVRSSIQPRREFGYQRGLHLSGLPFDESLVVRDLPSIRGGLASAQTLIDRNVDFDALFAYNDSMAIGAMQALSAAGIAVPGDVAVVGFDDIAMCEALVPPLTSVRLDRAAISREAIRLLKELRTGDSKPQRPVQIETELVIRSSS